MNVHIDIKGFSNLEDPAALDTLRAAVSQLALTAEQVGFPLRVYVMPEDSARILPPSVTHVTPATAVCGGADLMLHVYGTGFTDSSVIVFNGGEELTTYVSSTELTTGVKPSLAQAAVVVPVSVVGATTSANFAFTPAPPAGRARA